MPTDNNEAKIWYLNRVNLFKGMHKEEMMQLARLTEMKSYKKKDIIYLPGEPGNHVYLLKKGVVKLSKLLSDGRELTLTYLESGEIFGELETVSDMARNTQAMAHSDVMICVLSKKNLSDLVQSKPELGLRLSKFIGFRRYTIENRLENLIYRTIPQRLACILLELIEQFGLPVLLGKKINIPLTHQDIANLIGAARATVTETLLEFKKLDLIDSEGKYIVIKNPDSLKKYCQS